MKIIPCRSCGAPCFWAKTERGKMTLVNAEPDPKGNVVIQDGIAYVFRPDLLFDTSQPRYTSHFANCPQAKDWRKS